MVWRRMSEQKVLIRFCWWDVTSCRIDFNCCLTLTLKSYIIYMLMSGKAASSLSSEQSFVRWCCWLVWLVDWCCWIGLETEHCVNIKNILLHLVAISSNQPVLMLVVRLILDIVDLHIYWLRCWHCTQMVKFTQYSLFRFSIYIYIFW